MPDDKSTRSSPAHIQYPASESRAAIEAAVVADLLLPEEIFEERQDARRRAGEAPGASTHRPPAADTVFEAFLQGLQVLRDSELEALYAVEFVSMRFLRALIDDADYMPEVWLAAFKSQIAPEAV